MNRMARTAIAAVVSIPLWVGCTTTGRQNQTDAQVSATYRIVKQLETTVGPSVTKLNETTADLGARADASDKEIAKLQLMAEDNQKRLERIQSKLDKVASALYRSQGISGAGESPSPAPSADEPTIEPPTVKSKPEPVPDTPVKTETAPSVTPVPAEVPKTDTSSNAAADFEAAQASFNAKKYTDAVKQFKDFLQRYPDSDKCESAQIRVAYSYGQLSDYQGAAAEYSKFRANYPNSSNVPRALYNEATAYQKLNQKARAIELLKQLVENYPSRPESEMARKTLKALEASN